MPTRTSLRRSIGSPCSAFTRSGQTGYHRGRTGRARYLAAVREGDTLMVTKLDWRCHLLTLDDVAVGQDNHVQFARLIDVSRTTEYPQPRRATTWRITKSAS